MHAMTDGQDMAAAVHDDLNTLRTDPDQAHAGYTLGRMTLGAAPLTLTRALSPITPLMVMLVCAPAVPTTNRHNAANDLNISHPPMTPCRICAP